MGLGQDIINESWFEHHVAEQKYEKELSKRSNAKMQINIEVLNVTKSTGTSKVGKPYGIIEVAYKQDGQVRGKKLLEFKSKEICKTLSYASPGDKFTVTQEKEGEFWEWKEITSGATTAVSSGSSSTPVASAAKSTPKGDWETKEERALRQVMIVKQSSLSNAISTLKTDKSGADPDAVIALAQRYTDWVLAKPSVTAAETTEELTDDIPF